MIATHNNRLALLFTFICSTGILFSGCTSKHDCNENTLTPDWVEQLSKNFEEGTISYNDLLSHKSFDSLRTKAIYRKHFRALLLSIVDTSHGFIAGYDPQSEIQIRGTVIDDSNKERIPDVRIEFVQTGANGLYFVDDTMFNPVHFGFVKSDENGKFLLVASPPGYYPDGDNKPPPRHTHFNISTPGYRPYYGEFNYSDDTILQMLIADGENPGDPVARRFDDSVNIYSLTIPLQPLGSN